MKNTILSLFLFFCISVQAQSFDFKFDHYSMVVLDLSKTGDFYADILGLQEIPHPSNAEGFRWFSVHGNSQLHLIKKETISGDKNKSAHLCLATNNLPQLIEHLKQKDVPFYDWAGTKYAITDREDGVQQIYLQDPEGNWVEVNTAKHL